MVLVVRARVHPAYSVVAQVVFHVGAGVARPIVHNEYVGHSAIPVLYAQLIEPLDDVGGGRFFYGNHPRHSCSSVDEVEDVPHIVAVGHREDLDVGVDLVQFVGWFGAALAGGRALFDLAIRASTSIVVA